MMLHQEVLDYYLAHEKASHFTDEPRNLYEPINYILDLGGKKVRPVLTLLACSMYCGDYKKAKELAFALELFHNFTLLHDDVMDEAEQRRGKSTVHKKWDVATAILSGDEMLIRSCSIIHTVGIEHKLDFMSEFLTMATEVCQGQQSDMDFEQAQNIGVSQYTEMIKKKTAVLLALSIKFGAALGGASKSDQDIMYQYGIRVGLGFQMMDDYLDSFGDKNFGKRIGGDILEDKKTWLYIKALDLASTGQKAVIQHWHGKTSNAEEKIDAIQSIYVDLKIDKLILVEIEKYFESAATILQGQTGDDGSQLPIEEYVNCLSKRVI
jgi:geranylgeranyl diphosphate synthase, type II